MINSILKLSKVDRHKLLKNLNVATKKHIFEKIYTLTEELGLDKIEDFETRVKMRAEVIAKFPDTVFWDYAECANIESERRVGEVPDFERTTSVKVSTNGDVVVFNAGNQFYVQTVEVKKRYANVKIKSKSKTIHRIVASTFIPKPGRLKHIEYKHLQVNHKDHTKWNNKMSNLEWLTEKENIRHAERYERYDEEKYFLLKVVVDNGFKGREFVLSENEVDLIGANFRELVRASKRPDNPTFKGLEVKLIHHEDIKDTYLGFPEDIRELYNKNYKYFDTRVIPLIGTVLSGKYAELKFSLFGTGEISQFFNRAHAQASARGDLYAHGGCLFTSVTHKEAMPYHGVLTKEIAAEVRSVRMYNKIKKMFTGNEKDLRLNTCT